jgi:signal transduction histidine kinase
MMDKLRNLSPAVRLTAAYAVIIMAVSLFFSVALYRVSTDQLDSSLHRQYARLHRFAPTNMPAPLPLPYNLQNEIDAGGQHLRLELAYFNLVILILGTGASYWLARRTLRPIETALEAQSRFTADASHELRTPLTAMQSEIEVALRNPKFNKQEARDLLASNLEEIAKLKALSDGLLQLASNNGSHIEYRDVDMQGVVRAALKRVTPIAKKKNITVIDESEDVLAKGEPQSLIDLTVILLDNAVKYSPDGTTVRLAVRQHNLQAELRVADEGYGIKASDVPHIFSRFYRADTARSKQNGNGYGLGLSIAKKIVDIHNGTITVRSTPGKGSTFIVRLPLA